MTAKKATLEEIGAMLSHVVEHMATKDDIADIRREMATKEELKAFREETAESFRAIRAELSDIRRDLEVLKARWTICPATAKKLTTRLRASRGLKSTSVSASVPLVCKSIGVRPWL